ncbi:class II aldolase/adducin family protein [Afifella sp. JA880]|uniref:class II aldolase/adducin family protein n=1 Tax=Afifella sp. JA880 TaxID=2975280 RepID=UPI0021BA471F|nr:class II aldolase/adducin family protein [Afifella sp. JA880]MCT8267929.1 class II aldolase/adducin family protein [Afifella sp. JA880]
MSKTEKALRKAIIAACREMNSSGLNQGTAGNISARYKDRLLITPSGIPYDELEPEMIAALPLNGEYGAYEGPNKPSSEWRFHLDIAKARPEIGATVHTHAPYATTLAIARRDIPACHYMVTAFGGAEIRCAPYRKFGSKELSEVALEALQGRKGCLLANHGMIAIGADLERAMWLAVELEALARHYYQALLIGGPVLLSEHEIAEAGELMSGYGLAVELARDA